MRVTKTIQQYIRAEVTKRVYPKYQIEEAEAERQIKAQEAFIKALNEAAAKAYTEYFEAHFSEVADFCKDVRMASWGKNSPSLHPARPITISDRSNTTSVHGWHSRMLEEVEAKTNDIIITLELGGTRADLDNMLNNI